MLLASLWEVVPHLLLGFGSLLLTLPRDLNNNSIVITQVDTIQRDDAYLDGSVDASSLCVCACYIPGFLDQWSGSGRELREVASE